MIPLFSVTYELVSEESAENGEAEDYGYIAEDVDLREALRLVGKTESIHCERNGIEPSDSDIGSARWFTVYNSADYLTGDTESRSLHVPESVTPASRRRIARLLGVRA